MSSCSSRMSVSSSSSGPENCGSSTENGGGGATDDDVASPVIGRDRESQEPLPRFRNHVRPHPSDEKSAHEQRGPKPQVEQSPTEHEQRNENHQAKGSDLLIPNRERPRKQVLHDVRSIERGNRNQVERDED